MSEKTRLNKPVAFNRKREEDQKILAFTKRKNFSGFAKKAMLEYIERHQNKPKLQEVKTVVPIQKKEPVKLTPVSRVQDEPKPQPVKEKASDRMAKMKEQIKKPGTQQPGPAMFNQKR